MKKLFKFSTTTVVASGIGAAIFMLLFMFVKIPSPVPQTSFMTAYGFALFIATIYGPIAGGLSAFIGHALSDAIQYGSPWWSWVIASGVAGFIFGIAYKFTNVEEGELTWKDIFKINLFQVIANVISWIVIAPVLDILVYAEPSNKVFIQGVTAAMMNIISAGVIGTLLLAVYVATKPKKGSLKKVE